MAEWIIAGHVDHPAAADVLALAAHACALARDAGCTPVFLAVGHALCRDDCRRIAACGVQRIEFVRLETKLPFCGGTAQAVAARLQTLAPEVVLFSATDETRILAAQIAAHLGTGLTADCTNLCFRDGLLVQTRPAFGGNLIADIVCPARRPQMATVHPFAFAPQRIPAAAAEEVPVVTHTARIKDDAALLWEESVAAAPLGTAKAVLCGGLGLGHDGFRLLDALCHATGAALGATRAAVNAGLAPYACQIGQTGVGLAAKLYVGFGVSGAVQHIAGMRSCEKIIAVNTDADAPIARICDVFIHTDAIALLDALVKRACK